MKNFLVKIIFLSGFILISNRSAFAQWNGEPPSGDACKIEVGETDFAFQVPKWATNREFRTNLKCMVTYLKYSSDYSDTYRTSDEQILDVTITFSESSPYFKILQWHSTPIGDASYGPQRLMPYEFDKLLNNDHSKQYDEEVKTNNRYCRSGITWRPQGNFSYHYAKLQLKNDLANQRIDLKAYASHPSRDALFGIVDCKWAIGKGTEFYR